MRAEAVERVIFGDPLRVSADIPTPYEIKVGGTLDREWASLIEGMTLETVADGIKTVTVLHAVLQDQSALEGLLDALFAVNAKLLSVNVVEPTV
jgi:hypothetical protein